MPKLTTKPKKSKFVNAHIWEETKIRLVKLAKKRGEGLAKLVDDLSKI